MILLMFKQKCILSGGFSCVVFYFKIITIVGNVNSNFFVCSKLTFQYSDCLPLLCSFHKHF